MSRLSKIVKSTVIVAALATMAFGHLPSLNDASLKMGRIGGGDGASRARAGVDSFLVRGPWSKDSTYRGDYTIQKGDTVSHGNFNGKTLWWWAKFYSDSTSEPGNFGADGGTSPWVLINSLSAVATGTVNFTWKGWNGDMQGMTGLAAQVPTWRDGAEGAYSFTHDDIGAMPFDLSVQPGWDAAKPFPDIKTCWGVFVQEMTATDWENSRKMVLEGHEMFNHSMRHTSAADQWQWFYPGQTVPSHDPAIPKAIRGLDVVGTWKSTPAGATMKDFGVPYTTPIDTSAAVSGPLPNPASAPNVGNFAEPIWPVPASVEMSSDLVKITAPPYWTGWVPSTDQPVTSIAAQGGAVEITLATGQKQIVKYDQPVDSTSEEATNVGQIAATGATWFELGQIVKDFPNYYNGWWMQQWNEAGDGDWGHVTKLDAGRPGFVAKVWCVKAWEAADYKDNIQDANDTINKLIYDQLAGQFGEHFAANKTSEYFGYPFDAYSEITHDSLEQNGFVGARGGAKSGKPIPGDFFHPYRIDFDAFYIEEPDYTESSTGGKFVYPENPHVLLGMNEMVDSIIAQQGYMIREFHAVADIDQNSWYHATDPSEQWPLNSAAKNQGGWWGGVPKYMLTSHYNYVQSKIDAHELVVYTVGEVTKYRMTANATGAATITADGSNYKLAVATTETIAEKYRDEISVIISLPTAVDSLGAEYYNTSYLTPRRRPVNMTGSLPSTQWSVSIQPFLDGDLKIIPNGQWDGPTPVGDRATTSQSKAVDAYKFTGLRNGQVALSLPSGQYTAQLFNAAGRMVKSVNVNSAGGVTTTGLRTNTISNGLYILNVKKAGVSVLRDKILVK